MGSHAEFGQNQSSRGSTAQFCVPDQTPEFPQLDWKPQQFSCLCAIQVGTTIVFRTTPNYLCWCWALNFGPDVCRAMLLLLICLSGPRV